MPASQLKRLKASLRDQGITGQQNSKKQKKPSGKSGDDRSRRNAALQQIRDSFNPFEFKAPTARPEKFSSGDHKAANVNGTSGKYKEVLYRPGVSKSAGEQMRRATLLPELQRRNKVGGIVDRRIGEGDVDMTPEERAVQRFAREKERKRKCASLFDLDAFDEESAAHGSKLTHGGRGLDDLEADDLNDDISVDSESETSGDLLTRKRRLSELDEDEDEDEVEVDGQLERKKTKKEVMEEVIAKSKMHKYERQKVKEDDEDLREMLDQGMGEMMALLRNNRPKVLPVVTRSDETGPVMNADRQKLLEGVERSQVDKDYDARLKQLAQDARAKPSERTLTADEKAAADAARLQELEKSRVMRMQGVDNLGDDEAAPDAEHAGQDEEPIDQAAEFGFTSIVQPQRTDNRIILDDEDEFALDDDLIASGSEAGIDDIDSISVDEDSDQGNGHEDNDYDDNEFVKDILGADVVHASQAAGQNQQKSGAGASDLAFTYPCPENHPALLGIVQDLPPQQLLTIIQRIRALYHPSLSASNKEAMGGFAAALVDHLFYMGNQSHPLHVAEQVIRHLHSLSRTYPIQIGAAFRQHLAAFHARGQPVAGDYLVLTAIGSIFPTSDHWHQVVTPAVTLMARWLSLNVPSGGHDADERVFNTGTFFITMCIKYQQLSKRYIPEVLRFTFRALSVRPADPEPYITNLLVMAELWKALSAFSAMFSPFLPVLKSLSTKPAKVAHRTLSILLAQSRLSLRPLELHHHRPLPIRTSIPKFEESFNPDKHYDPDKERSDAKKLQKEYKRERKGALRELRKDANFVAREQLREKKERDQEYEKKYRKLVASVQAEEGAQQREWEREKAARKRKR